MSILAPAPYRPVAYATMQNANTGTGVGTDAIVEGYGTTILDVTISATGSIFLYGSATSTGATRLLDIQGPDGNFITSITQTGFYRVNTAGLYKLRASISANTGTITVVSTSLPITAVPQGVSLRRRNTVIADSGSIVLEAGANVSANALFPNSRTDVRDYAFVQYGVDAGADHTVGWQLDHLWTWHDNTGPSFSGYETLLSQTARRGRTGWLDVNSTGITAKLTNNDAVSRTYRVVMFGIR